MSFEAESRDRLARIETKLDTLLADYAARMKDHEDRIRGGERWRYALPTSLVLAMVSLASTFVHH